MTTKKHAADVAAPKGTHWHRYGKNWYLISDREYPVIVGYVCRQDGNWRAQEIFYKPEWLADLDEPAAYATRQDAQRALIDCLANDWNIHPHSLQTGA